jgi:hypothetical protein
MEEVRFSSVSNGERNDRWYYCFGNEITNSEEKLGADVELYHEGRKFLEFRAGTTEHELWKGVEEYFLVLYRRKKLEMV